MKNFFFTFFSLILCLELLASPNVTSLYADTAIILDTVVNINDLEKNIDIQTIKIVKDSLEKRDSSNIKKTAEVKKKKLFIPDPNKAMWYGLICPGLGQIYNRRYWKLPIVYGGFVALGYGISWNGKYYALYKQYYKDISDDNPNTKSYESLYSKIDPSIVNQAYLKDMMDNLRRNRDLCIIGTVAFYAITVLDAFVDASLSDFDISPDLSMKVSPTIIQDNNNLANLALKLNFKF